MSVASDDDVGPAPAFVDDIAQARVTRADAEYTVPILHCPGEKVGVIGDSMFSMKRLPPRSK